MRPWMSLVWPAPSTSVVLSLSTTIFLTFPRSSSLMFSSLTPRSSVIALPPVRITEDLGVKLENIKLEDLGKVKKMVVDKDNTTLVEGAGHTKDIQGRIKQIDRKSTRL